LITVLHVRNSNYPGGIETTLLGWFKASDRTQFNMELLAFKERRGIQERSVNLMEEQGLAIELLPWGHIRNLPGAVSKLLGIIRSNSNVIIHSHDTRSDLVSIIAAKLTGVPVVISNHAWHPADFKRQVLEWIRVRLMRSADLVISVSEDTHRETLKRGIPEQKSMALYSGIDLEPFQNLPSRDEGRTALNLSDEVFVVGNVARLWPEKEQDKIVEAAGILAERYPCLKFLIVGDGPLEEALKNQIAQAGLQDSVLLPGFRKDLTHVLAALDVFVFPSSAEGTPLVIYAAMAMALPIVASPVSGVGEVLKDNSTALLIPPADAKSLADAVEKLMNEPERAAQLGKEAKQSVEANYSVELAVRQLEQIYQKLDASRHG